MVAVIKVKENSSQSAEGGATPRSAVVLQSALVGRPAEWCSLTKWLFRARARETVACHAAPASMLPAVGGAI